MKCKECKSKIKKKSEFCPYCGVAFNLKNSAHIIIILDRSGSMSSVKNATIEGVNKFISDQKAVPLPATISLYQFDDIYEVVYENSNIRDARYLEDNTYQPRNTTALFDAIGKTINNYATYYNSLPTKEKPGKVLFCIITDGEENASKEFISRKSVKDLMDRVKNKYNWQFSFIGAGIDAYKEASSFGIARGQTYQGDNTPMGVSSFFTAHSQATTSYRTSSDNSGFAYKTTTTAKD